MKAFISGTGVISPQGVFSGTTLPVIPLESLGNRFSCIEPAYQEFLNPASARRMGRVIKMGVAAASLCIKDSGIQQPDAIVAGSALGVMGETEKFLKAIIADDEQFLTPTSFIQSLQNSVAAQVALHLNCTGHNFTFSHRGFSFENALMDGLLLLEENHTENVLVGGIDEMTDHNFSFYKKLGHWKNEIVASADLLKSETPGTIGGEGAAFFLLTREHGPNTIAKLEGIDMLYQPASNQEITIAVQNFLHNHQLETKDIDLVLYGNNGDSSTDQRYHIVKNDCFPKTPSGAFKHLCGEYQTSGSFAMWLAASVLKNKEVPAILRTDAIKMSRLERILIYNSYNDNHSFYLVSKP